MRRRRLRISPPVQPPPARRTPEPASEPEAGPRWSAVARTLASPGAVLEPAVRSEMQARFGRDFSRVRVHAEGAAAESAAGVGALAYTVGEDVVFAPGRYAPGTPAGRRLLAHELAHTVRHGHLRARGPASAAALLRRQAAPAAARSPQQDFVDETIAFFRSAAEFWALTTPDAARFDRVITAWYSMEVDRERMIDERLNGDAAVRERLRSAYIAAIRALVRSAARGLKTTEPELYRRNSGRIPLWAWPTAHRMVPGISTPIAQGRAPGAGGTVAFAANGISVTIAPDGTDPTRGGGAITNIDLRWTRMPPYRWESRGRRRVVTAVDPLPAPTARIQTLYGPGASAATPSGYGRGTTPEDVAGAAVTPASASLGFHEGSHGLDFVAFMEANPPPAFTGTAGMTEAEFQAAGTAYDTAMRAYNARMNADSEARTDCVGTTIDQFHRDAARPGQRIELVCGP